MTKIRVFLPLCLLTLLLVPSAVHAQTGGVQVVNFIDNMTFDRPEAWALKRFTSATLLGGFDVPRTREPGSVEVSLEAGWLPTLSEAQRRVGYNGTEDQDLNKAPVLLRPRITIGLPWRLSVTLAFVPPARLFGVKPLLGAAALERPVYESKALTVGVRGYGQIGHVDGAFTCPRDVLSFEPGSPQNMDGCQAESSDRSTFRYAGGEIGIAYRPQGRAYRISPHAGVSVNYMNLAFQVNALTFGYLDHTLLVAQGVTVAASAGINYRLSSRLTASFDAFYTPLSVRRSFGAPVTNDGLFNLRALFTYHVR